MSSRSRHHTQTDANHDVYMRSAAWERLWQILLQPSQTDEDNDDCSRANVLREEPRKDRTADCTDEDHR